MHISRKLFHFIIVYPLATAGFVLITSYFALNMNAFDSSGIIDKQFEGFYNFDRPNQMTFLPDDIVNSEEWKHFEVAVSKDKDVLVRVEKETGIKSRLIVSQLAAEQLSFFFSNRKLFKQVLSPLELFANRSTLSWGVMGIKPSTAIAIEYNLKASTSPYYIGKQYENILDYDSSTDIDQERFERLTDKNNRYYSYLYTALYNKQIIAQWKNFAVDLSDRPEILATLYNIGFKNSRPNLEPQVGGYEFDINGHKYSFGGFAYDFYYSSQLMDIFAH